MKYALITDTTVEGLYGKTFCQQFPDIQLFSFSPGEASKTRETKEKLENDLLSAGFTKDTTIIALGGGVVTDLVGFLASTFCRGVDLILIPTTLMGMVDAAIGGKNGVNTEHGKNMIGTIYPAKSVIIEPTFLQTLPEKERWCGIVEMLKAGLIADREYFEEFSSFSIQAAIDRAIEIKRRIISQDLTEKGLRRLLNFGHTIGHALETLSHYEMPHGEAVAAGIVIESHLSCELGFLKADQLDRILRRFPKPTITFEPEEILKTLRLDKKSSQGKARFVLLEAIGCPVAFDGAYCTEIDDAAVLSALNIFLDMNIPAKL